MVRHFFDLDYDVDIILNETLQVLSKTKPIVPDECYINDYIAQHPAKYTLPNGQLFKCTDELVPFFTGSAIMDTVKADMLELGNDICAEVRTEFSNADGLASITVGDSGSVGISTYIHVRLKQPTNADPYVANRIKSDPQFLNHYMSGYHNDGLSGEYNFKIRLSNHLKKNMRVEDAQINIDINNRVYEYFKDRVIYHIRNRLNYVNTAWDNYCKYGTLPKNQQKRNQERAAAKRAHRAWIYELYDKLNNDYVKEYLSYTHSTIDDVVQILSELYAVDDSISNHINKCINENIIEYTLTPNFNYSLLYEDIWKDMDENLVTDLRNSGIKISPKAINSIPYDIDIQNSNIQKINISKYQDIKGIFTLLVDNNEVIAIYDRDRFVYNPNKLKMSDVVNYDIYEVINNKGSVNDLRNQRQLSRQGYTDLRTSNTSYNKPPKSVRYVLDRDWNAEASKEYYTKLLHQNRLGKYAEQLEYAYTVIEDMIMHRRKEQTVGKKAVYTDWINKLTCKINAAELQMDALDKNVNIDIPKLIKSLNTLDKVVKDASKFIGYEDDAIATFGYTKQRPHAKIER